MEVLTPIIEPRTTPAHAIIPHVHAQSPDRPDLTELLTVLGSVPDPRDRRAVRVSLARLLNTRIAAVVAGARSFAAIGEYAAAQARTRPNLGWFLPRSG